MTVRDIGDDSESFDRQNVTLTHGLQLCVASAYVFDSRRKKEIIEAKL